MRMVRREVPKERIFFLVVLSCCLLLFSVVLLRGEVTTSSRTFRDGFIVANREVNGVTRRVESIKASNANMTIANDAEMTTITTQDGDEITIKRNAKNNKNKITTISAHENGKITIENVEKPADDKKETSVLRLAVGPDDKQEETPSSSSLAAFTMEEKPMPTTAVPQVSYQKEQKEAEATESEEPKTVKIVQVSRVENTRR